MIKVAITGILRSAYSFKTINHKQATNGKDDRSTSHKRKGDKVKESTAIAKGTNARRKLCAARLLSRSASVKICYTV